MDMDTKRFPAKPGVYIMRDKSGVVLYIGKAKNLRRRVSSYLKKEDKERYQIKFLMDRVDDISYVTTANEKEALLLEYKLIKEHNPRYNIDLKDNKKFIRIRLSHHNFPSITVTRRIRQDGSRYFGPYTSAYASRGMLDQAVRFFRLRTCSDREFLNRVRPCIQYDIGRCTAPCVGLVSRKEYAAQVEDAEMFLKGRNSELIRALKEKMRSASASLDYEKAAGFRDLIKDIRLMLEKQRVMKAEEEAEDARPDTYEELSTAIKKKLHLRIRPQVIECVDISNIQGKAASGSIVSFVNGYPDKKRYRLFNITREGPPNDYAMMHEVLERRFSHPEWGIPDLLMVDGGRGQLSIACKVLQSLNIELPVVAIAKIGSSHRRSSDIARVFLPDRINQVKFRRGDRALLYMIKIRDEAHRFCISHHRKRHIKLSIDG